MIFFSGDMKRSSASFMYKGERPNATCKRERKIAATLRMVTRNNDRIDTRAKDP